MTFIGRKLRYAANAPTQPLHNNSSYKLVTGREEKRYKRDVSGYDAVFGHARSTFDFGEQHQVQTGSRNITPNRKY